MEGNFKRFGLLLVVMALLCGLALAQTETGQIIGTVTDPQGAVVSGAKVTAKNTSTNAERSTTTNSNGLYTFTNLQPGTYEVRVDAANFAASTRKLDVTVGSRNTVDFPLAVTGTSTTVEVVSESNVQVETTQQQLSSVVNAQQITELPTLTRNAYSLVGTSGNVSGNSAGRGAGVAINGQRDSSTDILLDGGENVDLFTSSVGQDTPLDSVGEFRVITSNFSAEYGRASGGIVNVTTKSGTNAFHGTVFEFWRGAGLSSNTYDNNAIMTDAIQTGGCTGVDDPACPGRKPNFVRNQFGYSLGGPIVKDKLFFFSSTEWIRVRSTGSQTAWIVDDAYVHSGAVNANTVAFYDAYGTLKAGITPFDFFTGPSGVQFDEISYPVPSDSGGGAPRNEYQTIAKVDFNWTEKTQMYWRYALQSQDFFPGTVGSSPYVGFDTGQTVFNNNFLWNVTHIWSPNVVTQSKFNFNRLNNVQPLNGPPSPTLYTRAVGNQAIGGIGVMLPGYLPTTPGSGIPFGGPQNLYQLYQDLSWTKGKHQFRFGGQYIHTRDNRVFGAYETSGEALGTSFSTSDANFVNGQLLSFNGAIDPQGKFPCFTDPTGATIVTPECTLNLPISQPRFDRANRYHDFAFYAHDSWKLTPRFTLNLGTRWEYYGVQHNNDPSFDSNFFLGAGSSYYEKVRNGQVFTSTDPANPVGGLWTPDYNNWAPRVGFAWDLFGDGKTSLRGGYGMAYERNFGNVTFNVIQNPPNYAVISVTSSDPTCPCPVTVDNAGPLGGGGGTKPFAKPSLRAPIENMSTAYAHFWSLALEREIAKNTVFALEYSGSRGVKEYTIANVNRQATGPLFLGDDPGVQLNRRANDQYGADNQRGQGGQSFYGGLNVRVQTNNFMNSGLSFVTNYTWSHAIDNTSSTFSEFGNDFNLGLLNPSIPSEDKGDANFDIRHRWVMSGTWDTPWFKNDQSWFKKNLLGGWTFAPIMSVQSGNPFTVWDCLEVSFNVCPRWFNGQVLNTSAHDVAAPEGNFGGPVTSGGVNTWDYITYDPNLYFGPSYAIVPNCSGPATPSCNFGYFNEVTGTSEWGVCGVGEGSINGCPFPSNMTRRNSFRAPGLWNIDLGVYKTFALTERFKLQLRGEFYNMMNHSNLYVQGGSAESDNTQLGFLAYQLGYAVGSNTPLGVACDNTSVPCPAAVTAKRGGFGNTATDERRNIQFGIKLIF